MVEVENHEMEIDGQTIDFMDWLMVREVQEFGEVDEKSEVHQKHGFERE